MCPGWTRSAGPLLESMATWIVRARSSAEMPVVTPSRASMEIVNAVPNGVSLRSVICRRSSSSRSSVRQRQTRPRPCVAMKLIASGVANWAAIVRSPRSRGRPHPRPRRTSPRGCPRGRLRWLRTAWSRPSRLNRNRLPDQFPYLQADVGATSLAGEDADRVHVQPRVALGASVVDDGSRHLSPILALAGEALEMEGQGAPSSVSMTPWKSGT